MTARSGMTDLIQKVRRMCMLGTADYAVAGSTYWDDDTVQEELDRHRKFYNRVNMPYMSEFVEGTSRYYMYQLPALDLEGTAGGSAVFKITDGGGTALEGTVYAASLDDGIVTFVADQEGSARYYSGYGYDVNRTVVELWTQKMSHAQAAYDFSADGQRFTRSQMFTHAKEMRDYYAKQRGIQVVDVKRTDMAPIRDTFK